MHKFKSLPKMTNYSRCPREDHKFIIEKEDTVVCPICGTFEKSEIDRLEKGELRRDQILTIEEKEGIFGTLGIDPDRDKDIFD